MIGKIRNVRLGIFLNVGIGIVFIIAAVIIVITVNYTMRQQALIEAQSKARIILDRNLATHAYFSQIMKPSIFAWSEPFRSKDYFDHTWMSSTYAVREIEKYFKSFNPSGYSFKDSALNARSPENEADAFERAFIEKMNTDKKLESESIVRDIDGKPYLVVLRRGESMEASCLRCHSHPQNAPKGLTDYYGSERSFNRKTGDVISAVSLRIPLSEAYAAANVFSLKLSVILLAVLACLFTIQYGIYKRYLLEPLNVMRDKANRIATHEGHLGDQIPQPFGRELSELTATFNEMSVKLRHDRDHLEELVDQRTEELQVSFVKRQELEFIINHSPAVVWLWKAAEGWPVEYVSGNLTLYGYTPDDFTSGRIAFASIIHPDDLPRVGAEVEQYTREGRTEFTQEYRIFAKSGDIRWIDDRTWVRRRLDGSVTHYQGIAIDITDRKQAQEKIKTSLLEKETMLKEIHHRVKNNLQVISSLLSLQSGYVHDENYRKIFQESQDRVKVMANIHTMLYQSADLARVDFGGFIRDLAGRLQQSYGSAASPVEIHANVSDVSLPIETSIPCGLILNELVSNALKHAFPEGRGGEVNISMKAEGDHFTLTVQDNGIGFPEAVDFQNTQSLGLELVNLLVGQINGTIDLQVDGGTTFTITFPAVSGEAS